VADSDGEGCLSGLGPSSGVGGRVGRFEATARLLGLRINHPAAQDSLELLPNETATRAEAAFSGAQVLKFGDWTLPAVQTAATTFTLPAASDASRISRASACAASSSAARRRRCKSLFSS